MKNAMTSEKAAVFAVSQDTALTRLQLEYTALLSAKRYGEAQGVRKAMSILRRLDIHIIAQGDWRDSKL